MAILDQRVKKLEKARGATLYPYGKSKAQIVFEIPETPDPDTFYIHVVGIEPKFDENGDMIRYEK